ncbi:uncharacterized protein LOC123307755 isoform X1 [Coccinella septempunctata]|uniref:uncharacterized protein LOC123307755 isoform X1 n=1 Tax=Coccinella septempunctata TaxID=41139 RepID=UPI001D080F26|nr:uncharacterized protein LOC123307755 isoform X1 [Coccinella septempunctata]
MVCCSRRCIEGVRKREIEKVSIIKEELVTEKNISIDRTSDQPIKVDIQKIEIPTTKTKSATLICLEGPRIPFFSLLCTNNNDCTSLGDKMVCCKNRCITGVSPDRNEINQIAPKNKRIADQEITNEIPNSIGAKEYMTGEKIQSNISKVDNLVCPDKGVRIPFFSLPCVTNNDCTGKEMVCCSNRCIKGVLPKKPEIIHSPSWFGLVERNCPVDAIAEILEIKECETDSDCRPRICCPDQYRSQGNKSYCRTPQPSLHRFPLAERATEPFRVFASYIQCTPPPPPIFDLFPKSCNNALDCFPNLCCQEGDKKYCRPPKRSVLQLIAGVGQRFVPPDAAKKLIERLN